MIVTAESSPDKIEFHIDDSTFEVSGDHDDFVVDWMDALVRRILQEFSHRRGGPHQFVVNRLSEVGFEIEDCPQPEISERESTPRFNDESIVPMDQPFHNLRVFLGLEELFDEEALLMSVQRQGDISDEEAEAKLFDCRKKMKDFFREIPRNVQDQFRDETSHIMQQQFRGIDPKLESEVESFHERLRTIDAAEQRDSFVDLFRLGQSERLRDMSRYMSKRVLDEIVSNVSEVFQPSESSEFEAKLKARGMQDISPVSAAGFYDPHDKTMFLPYADDDMLGVVAHCCAHAIDQYSQLDDWDDAWQSDKEHGFLSDYAKKDRVEGFAEFARVLWTRGPVPARLGAPAMWQFWKRKGLL